MQTKQQIQQLLASAGTSPNKQLGQNFLIDLNLMQLLITSANITDTDIVLEVGCGTGSLTQALAEKAAKVISVEYDMVLANIAKNQLSDKQNTVIINTDVLENKHNLAPIVLDTIEQVRKNYSGRFLLVANLPYNVASPVIINLITGHVTIDAMYVTVQKEVASRMAAKPDGEHYGILSILLAAAGDIKIKRILKPTVFWPQPKVDSAIVCFTRDSKKLSRIRDIGLFCQIVNLFMQHRRKMLKSCTKFASLGSPLGTDQLKNIHNWPVIFEDSCIDPHSRPETVSPEGYISIANLCFEYLSKK
jgi:16S rRNA (adenine1518-N6/adenine1519-N6)-dimethyltransferase